MSLRIIILIIDDSLSITNNILKMKNIKLIAMTLLVAILTAQEQVNLLIAPNMFPYVTVFV